MNVEVVKAAQMLQGQCYRDAAQAGWWPLEVRENPLTFSNKLMLTVSELAEAMEADRKGLRDDHLPHRDGREVELADAAIRIFDLAGAYNMNLGEAIAEKMEYNRNRADHKKEARAAEGGKRY
jgi:NTP pyrophosphatase (non-canonical NTP hydrolase)